jgi:hypothetical protein
MPGGFMSTESEEATDQKEAVDALVNNGFLSQHTLKRNEEGLGRERK